MAATQTNLHQFFKTKKSARSTDSLKNAKQVDSIERLTAPAKTVEVSSKTVEEAVAETSPVTPKRKREVQEEVRRKRRRDNEHEPEGLRTPEASKSTGPLHLSAPRSAKKRLIMGTGEGETKKGEGESEGTIETGVSPSKQLKKDISKLTPVEVRERLGRCGRLDELRAKLLHVNQCGEKIRKFREHVNNTTDLRAALPPSPAKGPESPHLKKFSSLDVDVPISLQKTPVKTPTKTPVKAPAYQRLQHLAQKPSEELVLPFKFRVVKEVFRAVDTIVSLLHNRQEVVTYSKLKPAVQEMLRRTFYEHHLGQIKTVFPLAYFFKQEPIKSNVSSGTKSSCQLTVTANLDYKTRATQNLTSRFDDLAESSTPKVQYRKMDSVVLVERRNIFHNLLINIIKDHHEEFLKSLDPPITSSSVAIKRWHPAFPLEDLPEIDAASLPQPPTVEKFDTARDVLEKAHSLFSLNPRLERAVTDAAARTPPKPQPEQTPSVPSPTTSISTALSGVSASLLEKIRAREAAKTAREMTRSSGENKELEMLSRLPEIARIIRNIFVTEKKAALPWEMVAAKIAVSYTSMLAESEVDNHLHLLIKEVPGWCVIHKVRSGTFLKINKTVELATITDKLQEIIKQRQ